MRIVPTNTTPFYTVKTLLDGSQFQFQFQWNHETSTWSFDLYDTNGSPVVQGIKVVPGIALLGRSHYLDNCPPGELLCTTLDPVNDSPPGLVDLDLTPGTQGRCRLYYLPFNDLLAISTATGLTVDLLSDTG
jgi:hypothetical protein